MSDQTKFKLNLVAINKNEQIKRLGTFGDKLSDKVTAIAGSSLFLLANSVWFVIWILVNTGVFGDNLVFDKYPFGFLTMVVSLEAIILSVFVLISQNRQAERSEIRAEMDYVTDLQADAEINIILNILERIAHNQDVHVSDLLEQLNISQQKILREHHVIDDPEKLEI